MGRSWKESDQKLIFADSLSWIILGSILNQWGRRKYRISVGCMATRRQCDNNLCTFICWPSEDNQFGRSALCGELRCIFTLICNINLTLLVCTMEVAATCFPHNFAAVSGVFSANYFLLAGWVHVAVCRKRNCSTCVLGNAYYCNRRQIANLNVVATALNWSLMCGFFQEYMQPLSNIMLNSTLGLVLDFQYI